MALTHKQTEAINVGAAAHALTHTHTGDGATRREVPIAAEADDLQVLLNIDVSQIKSLWISADQALKLETNSATVPDDTIILVANEPVMWNENSKYACPLTADVTALYVTNTPAVAATLIIEVLEDTTP